MAALNFFEVRLRNSNEGLAKSQGDCEHEMSEPNVSAVRAGLRGRCPRCGKGQLFRSLLNLRDACENCGLNYRFIDTGDGPAVFGIFILGFLGLGGALIATLKYDVPQWIALPAVILILPVVALGLLRLLKGILIGLQYKYSAEEGRLTDE